MKMYVIGTSNPFHGSRTGSKKNYFGGSDPCFISYRLRHEPFQSVNPIKVVALNMDRQTDKVRTIAIFSRKYAKNIMKFNFQHIFHALLSVRPSQLLVFKKSTDFARLWLNRQLMNLRPACLKKGNFLGPVLGLTGGA